MKPSIPVPRQLLVASVTARSLAVTLSTGISAKTMRTNKSSPLARVKHATHDKGRRCTFDARVSAPPATTAPTQPETSTDLEPPLLGPNTDGSHMERYITLYFTHFHPRWPFLHRATFSASHEPSLLLYSVVMLGMWVTGKESCQRLALDLHKRLGGSIQGQQAAWAGLQNERERPASAWPIATYQGILLYLIFSLLTASETPRTLDLTIQLSLSDQSILTALVRTCLRHDVFSYPTMLGRYQDIDSVTCIWVGVEEMKRFALALYKICRICHRGRLDGAEANGLPLLCLSDLRFPVPDSNRLWEAESNPDLSNLLARTYRDANTEGRRDTKWISDCGVLLDGVDPGFCWI
ncbi:hypothetical protein BBP40_005619 [Aspergillus hancockii]|nr:hypothetical protein BBP40_005619 [Aspergillus hancockii]